MGDAAQEIKHLDVAQSLIGREVSSLIRHWHLATPVQDLRLHRADFEDFAQDFVDGSGLRDELTLRICILLEEVMQLELVGLEKKIDFSWIEYFVAHLLSRLNLNASKNFVVDKAANSLVHRHFTFAFVVLIDGNEDECFEELMSIEVRGRSLL